MPDLIIKDISLSEYGRKEPDIMETEMLGLMARRAEYDVSKPLKGARIAGILTHAVSGRVLIEILVGLDAEVQRAFCDI